MSTRSIAIMSISQACVSNVEKLDDVNFNSLKPMVQDMLKNTSLFIVMDTANYRILVDDKSPFLADRKIPITLLGEEVQDCLKDKNNV